MEWIEILLKPSPLLLNLYKLYDLYERSGCVTGTQSIFAVQEAGRQVAAIATRDRVLVPPADSSGRLELMSAGPVYGTGTLPSRSSAPSPSPSAGAGAGAVERAVQRMASTVVPPAAPSTPFPSATAGDVDAATAAAANRRAVEEARRQAEENLRRLKLRRIFEVLRDSIIQNLSRCASASYCIL